MGAFFAGAGQLWIMVSIIFAAAKISQREAPPAPTDEMGRMGGMTGPNTSTVVATLLVIGVAGFGGVPLGKLLCNTFGQSVLLAESWKLVAIQLNFFIAALLFSTYRKK
jgi:hypothetical protein